MPDPEETVYAVVALIPVGAVATYGQVADLAMGARVTARQVGHFMRNAPSGLPWHRVVGAGGRIATAERSVVLGVQQRDLLQAEAVSFVGSDRVDMARHQWKARAH